ncbi:MAG TPA: hypothetical protein DCE14_04825 [Kosmotogaceae bacterium]|nr:hypothetical protein [Kosmotogaceae bacterium]
MIEMISGYDRNLGGNEYSNLLTEIEDHLVRQGIDSSRIRRIEFPANGESITRTILSTVGWNSGEATLWMIRPEVKFVASTRNTPTALLVGSSPTRGSQELELVKLSEKRDYTGKAVLAEGSLDEVFQAACVQGGAKCILVYDMKHRCEMIGRTPEMMPDATNFLRIRQDRNSAELGVYGFSLNYESFLMLKKSVEAGETWIETRVCSSLDRNASLEVLEVDLVGEKQDDYFMIIAHLCHTSPGANDNASGAALALEIARLIVDSADVIPIKIVLVPEYIGSVPYAIKLKNEGALPQVVINLDMVGEEQLKTGSTLFLSSTPPVLDQVYDNILFQNLMKSAPKFDSIPLRRIYKIPFSGGSDHCAFLPLGVPAPFVGHLPDRYYHTNQDTTDKCDPEELEWVGEAVIRSLREFTETNKKLSPEVRAAQFGDFVYLLDVFKGIAGEREIIKLLSKTHHIEARLLAALYDDFTSQEEEFDRIKPVFDSSIGFGWISGLRSKVEWKEIGDIATLGEYINIVAAITENRDAAIRLVAHHYSLPERQVNDLVAHLCNEGLFESGGAIL